MKLTDPGTAGGVWDKKGKPAGIRLYPGIAALHTNIAERSRVKKFADAMSHIGFELRLKNWTLIILYFWTNEIKICIITLIINS